MVLGQFHLFDNAQQARHFHGIERVEDLALPQNRKLGRGSAVLARIQGVHNSADPPGLPQKTTYKVLNFFVVGDVI